MFSQVSLCDIEIIGDSTYYYNGELFSGKGISQYKNDVIAQELSFINGQLDGQAIYFNEKGDTISTYTYVKGNLNGISCSYNKNGVIIQKLLWSNNQVKRHLLATRPSGKKKYEYDTLLRSYNRYYFNGRPKEITDTVTNSIIWYRLNGNKKVMWNYFCRDSLISSFTHHGIQYYRNEKAKFEYTQTAHRIEFSTNKGPFYYKKSGEKYRIVNGSYLMLNQYFKFKKSDMILITKE